MLVWCSWHIIRPRTYRSRTRRTHYSRKICFAAAATAAAAAAAAAATTTAGTVCDSHSRRCVFLRVHVIFLFDPLLANPPSIYRLVIISWLLAGVHGYWDDLHEYQLQLIRHSSRGYHPHSASTLGKRIRDFSIYIRAIKSGVSRKTNRQY